MDIEEKVLDPELELDDDPDIEDTAEEEEESEDDTQENVVDSQGDDDVPKKKQSRDEQSAYARLRKKAEADVQKKLADELALLKAEMLAEKSKKKAAENEAKWEEEAEEQGIPVAFYKKVKRLELELEQSKSKKAESDDASISAKSDIDDFKAKFPDVDINKVIASDARFVRFSKKRLGAEPIAEIWADYTDVIGETETAALKKAVSKERRSTGTSSGGSRTYLTAAEQQSLEDWNSANPNMKMTAKEYLKRKGD